MTAMLSNKDQANIPELDRFEAARGKADVKWGTSELMTFLRGNLCSQNVNRGTNLTPPLKRES